MSPMKAENRAQAEALRRMHGNTLELIRIYAQDFREIIAEYETACGRPPTADDLIWLESERLGRDITKD